MVSISSIRPIKIKFYNILIDLSPHVETCVLLSHKIPDSHINVKVEFGEGEGKVPIDKIVKRAEESKTMEKLSMNEVL